MKIHTTVTVGLMLLGSLVLAPSADAQLLWRWFGPKTPEKTPPAKSNLPEERRVTEVNVEVAWLADPITFPYYLEAHATATQLEVRGYVPSREVREQAMRIAQVHSSLPVVDSMKEHASLLVRPGQMSSAQLQSSVQSSLKVALPKGYTQLKVNVASDGKVYVAGPVNTHEEKIAVSHSLRRLHGCTSVQNLTTLPTDLAQTPLPTPPAAPLVEPRERTPVVKTSNPDSKGEKPMVAVESRPRNWLWPFGKTPITTKDEPPLLEPRPAPARDPVLVAAKKPALGGPILIPDAAEPKELVKTPAPKPEIPAVPATIPALSAPELQKRVLAAWPNAKSVQVEFTSATEIRVVLEIRNEKELNPAAERVFAMPELMNYRADLQFKISSP